MRTHIPDLTIIFTCRIDFMARYHNILAALRYYSRYTDAHIIVLEADKRPYLQEIIKSEFPCVEYTFIKDENPVFHRTHYINEEFKMAKTVNVACIDVDTIVPIAQLKEANDALLNENLVMAIPYDGRARYECDFRSDLFRKTIDIRTFNSDIGYMRLMFGYISVGGAYICNIERYKKCGWENEHFIGWGPEDYERFMRLEILGHRPLQINGVIHHLNHPRGGNSGDFFDNVVLTTKREYCKICAMMPDELREYIKTWEWTL